MRKNDVFDKERFRHIQIREYRRMKVPELFIQILFNPKFTEERTEKHPAATVVKSDRSA